MTIDNLPQRYIGVLSGTSIDAIDCCLLEWGSIPKLTETYSHPIPIKIKKLLHNLCQTKHCSLENLGKLDATSGHLFSQAVFNLLNQAHLKTTDIYAIGSHGQTLLHGANQEPPFTLQIGDPNIISAQTHIITVSDFRRKDLASGGQGAPLAPLFHEAVFRTNQVNRIIVNIGGISNISILPKDKKKPVIGFDTGPGNTLMDYIARKHLNKPFDKSGHFASTGKYNKNLLDLFLSDPYFEKNFPKSTGSEYFNITWLEEGIKASKNKNIAPEDLQNTLINLTAKTISHEILKQSLDAEIYLCGGGIYNKILINHIETELNKPVQTTTVLGIDPDWVEAGLFAWLARQAVLGIPLNLKKITGSTHPLVLGNIFKPY